jgi:L-fuculokinase
MSKSIILVFDCGATNIRTIAVDEKGCLIAKSVMPNATKPDPYYPDYKIWDTEEIWGKLSKTCRDVMAQIDKSLLKGVTVTSFGVDGTPVLASGKLVYPVISWACQRTAPVMENIEKYIPWNELYALNGINKFSFNTINKLIWFKENKPEILDRCDHFAFISSILLHSLSGIWVTELTMAGTSMLTDIKTRRFSERILDAIGCTHVKFPAIVEAGTRVGSITSRAGRETGIPEGIPVIACGHDTQFAVIGSGAEINQPVLSSGTWEVLMSRAGEVKPDVPAFEQGVTVEFDAVTGVYDMGIQWLGSGILEWIKNSFYSKECSEMNQAEIYNLMIEEASREFQGPVTLSPDFLNNNGSIQGLGLNTKREEIYLAALHALANKTREAITILEGAGNFKAGMLLVAGGGSKNRLLNQMRANAAGIPVKVIDFDETTVLGAAIFTLYGAGIYASLDEAKREISFNISIVLPA